MGRSSKQRAALKAKRSASETSKLVTEFSLSNVCKPLGDQHVLTVGRVFDVSTSPNVEALIPVDKKNENWVSYVPFVSSKSSRYFGFVFYNKDFSQSFVLGLANATGNLMFNNGDFAGMFGYSYQEIQQFVTLHILRVLSGEIAA